jgi:hypothetical protein
MIARFRTRFTSWGRVHALKGNIDRSKEYLNKVIADYGEEEHPAAQLAKDFFR